MVRDKAAIIKVLKQDYHTTTIANVLKLFALQRTMNHEKMDVAEKGEFKKLQGQNQLLKSFIKDLSTNRETKFTGM